MLASGRVLANVRTVGCGDYHSLVATNDAKHPLLACGLNNYGQLGTKSEKEFASAEFLHPVYLQNVQEELGISSLSFEQVLGGTHHSLALCSGGGILLSFGRGDYGQLGIGPEVVKEMAGSSRALPVICHVDSLLLKVPGKQESLPISTNLTP